MPLRRAPHLRMAIHRLIRLYQWQANGEGVYDVQYDVREVPDDRARIVAEPDGSFNYRAVLPTAYPIVRLLLTSYASKH